jgi:hypothetical protein
LFLILDEMMLAFLPFSMESSVSLSNITFIMFRKSFWYQICSVLSWRAVGFYQMLFLSFMHLFHRNISYVLQLLHVVLLITFAIGYCYYGLKKWIWFFHTDVSINSLISFNNFL